MEELMRNVFLYLSKNQGLNHAAKKWGLRFGASRFVAGMTIPDAIRAVNDLNRKGIVATLDHLGEFVTSREEANESADYCIRTLDAIADAGVKSNLSLKLTQLGLDIDKNLCMRNMRRILDVAQSHDNFVRIDMEDYAHNEVTISIFKELRREYGKHVGLVLQAYLYKTEKDIDDLHEFRPNLRLVKGAYKEPKEVAFPLKTDVDKNFIKIIEKHLLLGNYAAVATHDEAVIQHVKAFTEKHNIPRSQFEFQMLYGIRTGLQEQLAKEGYTMRVYVPYGNDWYGYFMRRLAERPANVAFVIKSMFKN
ncbi:proline dehydrogenase [Collibacillus ludicampi]|uniref:proline dehydrogenase n=1 Tax=Collibacillus ludicampi TaxID=2771369 RepID=A0AAV4LAS2_9BACL|nr:proline dehydrogenase [Collibacillus ludicampi]GIM44932.1 proline dehydrogenase [Collibacillus ludicampi]